MFIILRNNFIQRNGVLEKGNENSIWETFPHETFLRLCIPITVPHIVAEIKETNANRKTNKLPALFGSDPFMLLDPESVSRWPGYVTNWCRIQVQFQSLNYWPRSAWPRNWSGFMRPWIRVESDPGGVSIVQCEHSFTRHRNNCVRVNTALIWHDVMNIRTQKCT